MKKVSTVAVKQSRKISQQKLTVGLDLGDCNSWYCVLDESGQIQLEQRVRTNGKALREVFGEMTHKRVQRAHRETGAGQLSAGGTAEADQGSGHADRTDLLAETRTPNMHRAKTNRSSRVRMEAWRQWLNSAGEKNLV